jgi:predicted amidohydrolase
VTSASMNHRIAGVQMDVAIGQVATNRTRLLEKLREAAQPGAQLVVFPECALTGYGFESRDEALKHAETIPGPSVREIQAECAALGVCAVFGMLERDGDRLFNACVLVGPDGVIGSYRKVHLPILGVDRFADPGDRPFAVHDAAGIRIGMHICYDGSFPETGRVLSLLGADLLVLPTNWPRHGESVAEHLMICRAIENTVYTIAVNRVGEERGFHYIGRSSIAGPSGERLAMAGPQNEEIFFADIDVEKARHKRLVHQPGKHELDRIGHRRPAFYGAIAEPNGRD